MNLFHRAFVNGAVLAASRGKVARQRTDGPVPIGATWQPKSETLRGGFRPYRPMAGHMFDDDLLAVVVAVIPSMRDPAMQSAVAYDHDFLRAGPMARPHLVSNRLRLRGLNTFLRRCGRRRRGGILGEGRRAQAESGDGGERQYKLIHDLLLG